MAGLSGLTKQGLDLALSLKANYLGGNPTVALGGEGNLLMPEHFLNSNIDLKNYEDPLPLAMVASRDPDTPMSIAAAIRICKNKPDDSIANDIFGLLRETSKHTVVKQSVDIILTSAFNPDVVSRLRHDIGRFVSISRRHYTEVLKKNLRGLLDGKFDARTFVEEFYELSEAGNLRIDIRKRLILSLLLSDKIRPSIKFLFLEHIDRLPTCVRREIRKAILGAPDTANISFIKKEIVWTNLV